MRAVEEKITEAELEVMEVLWNAGEPVTLGQIRKALAERNGETVKTLLRRLCAKGAAAREKGRVGCYRPLVSREELSCYRTRKLIDKLYAGSARQMVAALVEHDQLSGADIAELKALLDSLDGKGES